MLSRPIRRTAVLASCVSLFLGTGLLRAQIIVPPGCTDRTIACGETATETLTVDPCATSLLGFLSSLDFWRFEGTEGDEVTLELTTGENLAPFLNLVSPSFEDFAEAENPEALPTVQLTTSLDQTGTWYLLAFIVGVPTDPDYTLTLTCQTAPPPPTPSEPCDPNDPQSLCLVDDRFQVQVDWRTNQGTSGQGTAVRLTPDTGYFWFFNDSNVELVIKVLDTCSFSDRFWVFAGGLTNVEVDITVTDTQENVTRTYHNDLDTPFQPIQDTNAFATCP
jgi:hypothetical protein